MTERLQGALFRRSPAGAAVLTLVALGLGAWGVANSPLFGVGRIRIEGAASLTAGQVRRLSGVAPGVNLLRLSVSGVASAVERSPWVAEVTARRQLPSTLVIEVVERRAAGWVEDPGGGAVVATDGTIVARGPEPQEGLPSLGSAPRTLQPGERLPELPATLQVAASLAPRVLRTVASVAVVGEEVLVELRDGGTIRYGEPVRLPQKSAALAKMLAWADQRGVGVRSIDLRIPGTPALLPVSAT